MNRRILKAVFAFFLMGAVLLTAAPQTGTVNPEPPAMLEKSVFEARGQYDTVLRINRPGRYSIQVSSQQGTALQIVDHMAGPFHRDGNPGKTDGRMDLVLDKGIYKIRLFSHGNGSGQATLKVFPFDEVKKAERMEELPYLKEHELIRETLSDLQRHGFWIEIKDRRVLRLEMLGRCLKDARLWRDGNWLEGINPTSQTFEPIPGETMTHLEFHHTLEPGLYLLTCWGGPQPPWPKETGSNPFYLRMGVKHLGANGQHYMKISPFGRDCFLVDRETNYFQLVRKDKKYSRLMVGKHKDTLSRFDNVYREAKIEKRSRDPWCGIHGSTGGKYQWVTLRARPGDKVELRFFERRHKYDMGKRVFRGWLSTIHSAEGRDAGDVNGLISHPKIDTPVKAEFITVGPDKPLVRKTNLLGELSFFVFIEKEGTYTVHEGPGGTADARYRLSPLVVDRSEKFQSSGYQKAGEDIELIPGYYEFTIKPHFNGIIHFALAKRGNWISRSSKALFKEPAKTRVDKLYPNAAGDALVWPAVKLDYRSSGYYTLWLNRRPMVETGIVLRTLPLDLRDPLPMTLKPGQKVVMKVRHSNSMKLDITGGDYALKIDTVPWNGSERLKPGLHHLELTNTGDCARLFNVRAHLFEIPAPPPPPVLKRLDEIFPVLTEQKPLFRDFEVEQERQFLLKVETPGLYRLETTGRMATGITVRTRTVTSLFKAARNGVGRNALIQQFFKPGDYLVGVQTLGQSAGRAGIRLRRSPLTEVSGLYPGTIKRASVPPDAAVKYQIQIDKSGRYRVNTYSLGKKLYFRLEDGEGWPMTGPNASGGDQGTLEPGTYYYYTLPAPIASRRLTFLERIPDIPPISGKGPHVLKLNRQLHNTWMEDDQRSPDVYRAAIPARIETILELTGGMEAVILDNQNNEIAATGNGKWQGWLEGGDYRVQVRAKEKNNKMDYSIHLQTNELAPGLTQFLSGGSKILWVSLDKDSLVDITSFGDSDVRAELWDSNGKHRIAAVDDIPDDWNVRISRNLKAGRYYLDVESADPGKPSFDTVFRMKTRDRVTEPPQTLPFDISRTLKEKMAEIPFSTGTAETLVHLKTPEGGGMKLVLMKGGRLLAEAQEELYIPLPPNSEYTLLAWNMEDVTGESVIRGLNVNPEPAMVTGGRQTIPARGPLLLKNEQGLSFRFRTGGDSGLLYSPALERPCLPVEGTVENTLENRGWLVTGNNRRVRLETVTLKSTGSDDVLLSERPFVFEINQPGPAPMLMRVTSVNALSGASVFPAGQVPGNVFQRSGMLARPSRTLAGIPGGGQYRAHVWLTSPHPAVTSQQVRLHNAERTGVTLTPFPKQKQIDFTAVPSVQSEVEPGRSIWLRLKEEPQRLGLTLARGLVVFSWRNGLPVGITAAQDKNLQTGTNVTGGMLYVLNTAERTARFRVEKQGPPDTRMTTPDLKTGFGIVKSTAGTMQFRLPALPAGTRLFAAGSGMSCRLWGTDGKIYDGTPGPIRSNFDMVYFENIDGGTLEIHHGAGLVKIWQATDDGLSICGPDPVEAVFENNMGQLAGLPQSWAFTLDAPRYITAETVTPTIFALESDGKILYLSAAAFRTGHRLNHYLPAGTYRIRTHVLPGDAPPGVVTLNITAPRELDETIEAPVQIIKPGEIQVYRFQVFAKSTVGVGLRTENDSLEARVFDHESRLIGEGPLLIEELEPGKYLMTVTCGGAPVQYRPVILGNRGSRAGAPHDVVEKYKKEAN